MTGSYRERSALPTAGELMEKDVICVDPDTPLLEVHRLFLEAQIHGAPVVDGERTVVGAISTVDLLRAVAQEHETMRAQPDYFRELLPYTSPDWAATSEDFQDRLRELRAEDAMTTLVVSVSSRTPAPEVARTLREHRIHRVFVLDNGRLLGVLSAFDLLRLLENGEND